LDPPVGRAGDLRGAVFMRRVGVALLADLSSEDMPRHLSTKVSRLAVKPPERVADAFTGTFF